MTVRLIVPKSRLRAGDLIIGTSRSVKRQRGGSVWDRPDFWALPTSRRSTTTAVFAWSKYFVVVRGLPQPTAPRYDTMTAGYHTNPLDLRGPDNIERANIMNIQPGQFYRRTFGASESGRDVVLITRVRRPNDRALSDAEYVVVANDKSRTYVGSTYAVWIQDIAADTFCTWTRVTGPTLDAPAFEEPIKVGDLVRIVRSTRSVGSSSFYSQDWSVRFIEDGWATIRQPGSVGPATVKLTDLQRVQCGS